MMEYLHVLILYVYFYSCFFTIIFAPTTILKVFFTLPAMIAGVDSELQDIVLMILN